MDLASIIGLLGCIGCVLFAIMKDDVTAIGNFADAASVLITIGGTLFCMLVMSGSIKEYINKLKSFILVTKVTNTNEAEMIGQIIELSNIARKEGLLALEEAAQEIEDDFMKKGVLLIVDGTDPELVRDILETEMMCVSERHSSNIGFWNDFAAMGPAWGMIGTLVGLINMLRSLDDFATIGPNMSVALITTLYGSLVANWLCTPVANKLKAKDESEMMIKEVMIEGLLSIQAGENPRVIEEKLKSFLPPSMRSNGNGDAANEGGEE